MTVSLTEALYTTRAMRRVRRDPIPPGVQARILDAAVRAPTGGNLQDWRFLLVDAPEVKQSLGPVYRTALSTLWATLYRSRISAAESAPDTDEARETLRLVSSAEHLADNFEDVPLLLFAFSRNDPSGGSIFPSVWNAMLAARGEGVGSAITSVLNLFAEAETMEVLGAPSDRGWELACCVTFGYPIGRWGIARRRPVHEVSYRNQWGSDLGLRIDDPLWTAPTTPGHPIASEQPGHAAEVQH